MLVKACQTSSLLLFKFWQGLYLLMSSYNLIYTMNFTMKYDIVPFSHILVHSKFRIFGLAEAQILSEPNLISTNERRDNIRPMRKGYYFPISGSHLRPAVYLGEFSFVSMGLIKRGGQGPPRSQTQNLPQIMLK